jgi:protein-glutamine gamma-glutamyltransferase
MERLLQITTGLLVTLGTLLLGIGQRDPVWPMVMMVAAVVSFVLVDLTRRFSLNSTLASLLAFGASLFVFYNAMPISSIMSVLAIAQLLVYLQLVLLFQTKHPRIYWELAVLSLLEVVVSSLFMHGAIFGVLTTIYLFAGLSFLALMLIHQERIRAQLPSQSPKSMTSELPPESLVRESVGWRFLVQIVKFSFLTIGLSAVVFFIFPRIGLPAWQGQIVNPISLVGYTSEVELGSLGPSLQDPKEVFRARFYDPITKEKIVTQLPLYFQGAALPDYKDRKWTFINKYKHELQAVNLKDYSVYPETCMGTLKSLERQLSDAVVVQKIDMEPIDRPEVFAIRPVYRTVSRDGLEVLSDSLRDRLIRDQSLWNKRFQYELYTTGLMHGWQMRWVPARYQVNEERLLKLPADRLPTLVECGKNWAARSGIDPNERFELVQYLEGHFNASDGFSYSMNAVRKDWDIDPVEDFMKNNRQGHCEYFASALALLLRSVGIPSRLVVGFKTDEFNELGEYYQVRQLNAHTWVEAYFPPEMIPEDILSIKNDWSNGAWFRLDPTPAGAGFQDGTNGWLAPLLSATDLLDFAWNNYVVEMDGSRQRRAVYSPMASSLTQFWHRITDPSWWRHQWSQAKKYLDWGSLKNVSSWFSLRGGLILFGVGIALVLIYRIGRFVGPILVSLVKNFRRTTALVRRSDLVFYRRFQNLLKDQGLRRRIGQTDREFAFAAGGKLAGKMDDPKIESLCVELADWYYDVRFGHKRLDSTRRRKVEQLLGDLEGRLPRPIPLFGRLFKRYTLLFAKGD